MKNLANDADTLFLIGRWHDDGTPWEVMGIFDNLQMALDTCKTGNDFIFATPKNQVGPEDCVSMPPEDYYYPLMEDMPASFREKHKRYANGGVFYDYFLTITSLDGETVDVKIPMKGK